MSIPVDNIVRLVTGILADPGSSSKDHQKVVQKAIDLHKEVEYQVKRENERLQRNPQAELNERQRHELQDQGLDQRTADDKDNLAAKAENNRLSKRTTEEGKLEQARRPNEEQDRLSKRTGEEQKLEQARQPSSEYDALTKHASTPSTPATPVTTKNADQPASHATPSTNPVVPARPTTPATPKKV